MPSVQQLAQASQVPAQPTGNFLSGYSGYQQQLPRFTPQQQQTLNQLLESGTKNFGIEPIIQREMTRFRRDILPSLSHRLESMGAGVGTSGFEGSQLMAGTDLSERLAALQSEHGLRQLQLGLTPSFENVYIPGQPGFFQGFAPAAGQTAGQLIPQLIEKGFQYGTPLAQSAIEKATPYISAAATGVGSALGGPVGGAAAGLGAAGIGALLAYLYNQYKSQPTPPDQRLGGS